MYLQSFIFLIFFRCSFGGRVIVLNSLSIIRLGKHDSMKMAKLVVEVMYVLEAVFWGAI